MKKTSAPSKRVQVLGEQDSNIPSAKKLASNSLDKLRSPFKIPISCNNSSETERIRKVPQRKAAKNIDYSGLVSENAENDNLLSLYSENGTLIGIKSKFPRLNQQALGIASTTLQRKFVIPLITPREDLAYMPPPSLGMRRQVDFVPRPLYDPCAEFAIVLFDPTIDGVKPPEQIEPESENPNKNEVNSLVPIKKRKKTVAEMLGLDTLSEKKKEHPKVAVVLDPKLKLRDHQIEGVKLLYRCVMGLVQENATGCILADEMGLGKTLQCIALMWTLLKQSPEGHRGTIEKCIVICPASLVRNWANELVKWLGAGAITPLAIDGKSVKGADVSTALRQWASVRGRQIVRPVLIISYETLRRNIDDLQGAEVGLLLCDEGHRLKNGESLTFTSLDMLNCSRRVILSGTPIQNDLTEYFTLLSFAIPGVLGTRQEFRKNYESKILRGRDADATESDIQKGDECLKELSQLVSKFIIRRANDLLSKYLPIKYEHVVFCDLAPLQKNLYNHFITSPEVATLLRGVGSQPLKAVGLLRKLCNHPDLLNLPTDIEGSERVLPEDYIPKRDRRGRDREIKTWYSGKLMVLERMLERIRRDTNDKIVIISNFTQTLDIIEQMCRTMKYRSLRLDGKMAIAKRQKLVDTFNDPDSEEFIFLLSSKAGGCGINLIGANRLILFDPDWNPASDQQALARVWRDGQKKDCFVYRFIATGTIEEKIFQRQSMKQSLSSCVVDENEDVDRLFSAGGLRKLFGYLPDTLSDTHDTFKCKRCKGGKQTIRAPAMLYGDATTWNHFTKKDLNSIEDLLLRQELDFEILTYVFQYISH